MENDMSGLVEMQTYRKCPRCNSGDLSHRIPRQIFIKIIFGDTLKRYRCNNCFRKVYVKASS